MDSAKISKEDQEDVLSTLKDLTQPDGWSIYLLKRKVRR
jgi:hypothetical protein